MLSKIIVKKQISVNTGDPECYRKRFEVADSEKKIPANQSFAGISIK